MWNWLKMKNRRKPPSAEVSEQNDRAAERRERLRPADDEAGLSLEEQEQDGLRPEQLLLVCLWIKALFMQTDDDRGSNRGADVPQQTCGRCGRDSLSGCRSMPAWFTSSSADHIYYEPSHTDAAAQPDETDSLPKPKIKHGLHHKWAALGFASSSSSSCSSQPGPDVLNWSRSDGWLLLLSDLGPEAAATGGPSYSNICFSLCSSSPSPLHHSIISLSELQHWSP